MRAQQTPAPVRRLLLAAAGVVAALLVAALAAAVYVSERTPTPAGDAAASTACSPRPCADLEGYSLWVTGVQAQDGLVTLQVSFRNASSSTHAEPLDFRLVDAGNHSSAPVFDAPGCTRWPRTEFRNGARFGPVPLCFRTGSPAPPLRLRWSPDVGFFCCRTDVRIA